MKISNFMLRFFGSSTQSAFRMKCLELAPVEKDIQARSPSCIKKKELGRILMRNLIIKLANKGVSHHEKNKLLWHLSTYYEKERWRKKGLMESEEISKISPPPWPHETPLRVKLLSLIYQSTSNKFWEQLCF